MSQRGPKRCRERARMAPGGSETAVLPDRLTADGHFPLPGYGPPGVPTGTGLPPRQGDDPGP